MAHRALRVPEAPPPNQRTVPRSRAPAPSRREGVDHARRTPGRAPASLPVTSIPSHSSHVLTGPTDVYNFPPCPPPPPSPTAAASAAGGRARGWTSVRRGPSPRPRTRTPSLPPSAQGAPGSSLLAPGLRAPGLCRGPAGEAVAGHRGGVLLDRPMGLMSWVLPHAFCFDPLLDVLRVPVREKGLRCKFDGGCQRRGGD